MTPKNILFLDVVHDCLQKELEGLGYQCDLKTTEPRSEIEKIISHYSGIVVRSRITLDKKILSLAKNLKFIARSGSGMESIDLKYAQKKGIKCFNSPEGNRDAVAEQALGMLLCLFNNISKADQEVREGIWHREGNRGIELNGKTIGIIGYGNTGSTFAKKLCGMDVKILAYDKYLKKAGNQKSDAGRVYRVSMDELFNEADVVSLHIPLTEETHYLVDNSFIKKFKKNICLINTSRGPVVKTDDLVSNIKSGKISGACLDVIEYEETSFENVGRKNSGSLESFEYLKKSDKVILTPHIAGWTFESYKKLSQVLGDKIRKEFH